MKYRNNCSRSRSRVALVLSFVVFLAFPFAQSTQRTIAQDKVEANDSTLGSATSQDRNLELTLSSASATLSRDGVFLQWHTSFELDYVGFNIYRAQNGQRSRANNSIIPGSVFAVGEGKPVTGGRSYQWLDREGKADSV